MTSGHFYFAYGSNMNPERVADRGLFTRGETGATLRGFRMLFNKRSTGIPGVGHANIEYDKKSVVEGVLYELAYPGVTFLHPRGLYARIIFSNRGDKIVKMAAVKGIV